MSDTVNSQDISGKNAGSPVNRTVITIAGRIISLFVHELNNHLAVIGEHSGLADDLIAARRLSDADKLKEIGQTIGMIERRVALASSLLKRLDSIAGRMDKCTTLLDADDAISELMPFLEKAGKRKNIWIKHSAGRRVPELSGDKLVFQCLIFALVEELCRGLGPQTVVTITCDSKSGSVIVGLRHDLPAPDQDDSAKWSEDTLRELAQMLAAEISKTEGGVELKFVAHGC